MYDDNVYICKKIFFEYYLLIIIYVKRLVGGKMERIMFRVIMIYYFVIM